MNTLADLNLLRVANGKTELKSWKESKAKLEAAITKEADIRDERNTKNIVAKQIEENKKANEKIVKRTVNGKRYVGPAKNAPKIEAPAKGKYNMPEGLTQSQKKVWRAKARRAAAKK